MDYNFSPVVDSKNLNISILPITKKDRMRDKKKHNKTKRKVMCAELKQDADEEGMESQQTQGIEATAASTAVVMCAELKQDADEECMESQQTQGIEATAASTAVDTGEASEELKNIRQPHIPLPNTSKSFYVTRQIKFHGRHIRIICQESNGPCSLIAICNALLLKGDIRLESNATMVHEKELIMLLLEFLENRKGVPCSELPRQIFDILQKLSVPLEVNVVFNRTDGFVEMPQISLFRDLNISLYHGWLLDPDDADFAALSPYSSYYALYEAFFDPEFQNVDLAKKFLKGPQLTSYGLRSLRNDLKEEAPCVLFWQNHFSAVIKIKEELYALVTDSGYLESSVVWERLLSEAGGELVDCNFIPIVRAPHIPPSFQDLPGTSSSMSVHSSGQLISEVSDGRISFIRRRTANLFTDDDDNYLESLQKFAELPRNQFSEAKTLCAKGTSLIVADTSKIGRIIASDLLQQIVQAHQAKCSWNGKFDRRSIYVNGRYRARITAQFCEYTDNTLPIAYMTNDYTAYVVEVLSLFEPEKLGYPAFFRLLINTLTESDLSTMSHFDLACFWDRIQSHLALKFSSARQDFYGGIQRIRRNSSRRVRWALRNLLRSAPLADDDDWRALTYDGGQGHPLLRKVLRYKGKNHEQKDDETEEDKRFGKYLNTLDSASEYARNVNEHAEDDEDVKEDADEEVEPFYEPVELLSELDLLYSHFLEEHLSAVHELVVTSVSEELFLLLEELFELYERPEVITNRVS